MSQTTKLGLKHKAANVMKWIIQKRKEIPEEIWDRFVSESDGAWIWHLSDLQNAFLKWPWRTDFSFAVLSQDSQEVVAIIPLQLIERPILPPLKKKKFDSFGGPALRNNLSSKEVKAIYSLVQEHLMNLQKEIHPWEFQLSLAPMTPSLRGESCPRINPLVFFGCENRVSQTWVIDLRGDENQILKNYSESTGRKIRRANEQAYVLRDAIGKQDCEIYYELHKETYKRSGLKANPKAYYEHLFTHVLRKGYGRFVFCEKQGEVVAAIGMAMFKQGAYYWMGASLSEKQGLETQLLMHNQILYAKRAGCTYFDCGEAYPQKQEGKLKGMSEFKRSFGGDLYPIFRGHIGPATKGLRGLLSLEHFIKEVRA